MSTTYARTINSLNIYAAICDADAEGNSITSTYATKGEVQAIDDVPTVTDQDNGKVLQAAYSQGAGSYSWVTPPSVDEVPPVVSGDDGKLLKASYAGSTGSYSWETVSIPTIGTVTI